MVIKYFKYDKIQGRRGEVCPSVEPAPGDHWHVAGPRGGVHPGDGGEGPAPRLPHPTHHTPAARQRGVHRGALCRKRLQGEWIQNKWSEKRQVPFYGLLSLSICPSRMFWSGPDFLTKSIRLGYFPHIWKFLASKTSAFLYSAFPRVLEPLRFSLSIWNYNFVSLSFCWKGNFPVTHPVRPSVGRLVSLFVKIS